MKIKPFFRWYDLWIGAYIDVENKAIYICPIPTLGVKIELHRALLGRGTDALRKIVDGYERWT